MVPRIFRGDLACHLVSTSFFSTPVKNYTEGNHWLLLAALVAALCGALWRAREPLAVVVPLRHTNTEITIRFGDLFGAMGDHLVIPVNNEYDGALGAAVDPKSVHGQLIQKLYNGSQREFEVGVRQTADEINRGAERPQGPQAVLFDRRCYSRPARWAQRFPVRAVAH